MEKLKIVYRTNQEHDIDKLLVEMKDEGEVLHIEKEMMMMVGNELADMVGYIITFNRAYAIYLFGHKSASLFGHSN